MQGQSVVSQIIRCAKKSFMLQTEDEKKQSIVVKNSHKYMSQLIYKKKNEVEFRKRCQGIYRFLPFIRLK